MLNFFKLCETCPNPFLVLKPQSSLSLPQSKAKCLSTSLCFVYWIPRASCRKENLGGQPPRSEQKLSR